ncbi:hypothetical protein VW29_15190 [Devosia limi DSM 17137]|uniref:RND family efflux transporter, MFP subunit n=1 Tax=Devosia limi DSM 17137 TaxID=1121477 RepID=A0A0F5LKD2_9HYPH|nr:efflux RND transporter periplasmic adaptor subunit [Devosia limi]KKB82891.1 hypothetical protein VW29_15190 [Devosia limi DSM 17137]SHF50469.1 RND family efflux transporter, MFP subunit [Devosia limi DSM 17137]
MTANFSKPDWAQSKHDKENVARIAAGEKPRRRRWPLILLGVVVLAIVGFVAFQLLKPPAAEPDVVATVPVMQLNPAEVATIEPQVLAQTVRVTGSLEPQRLTQLGSQVSGRVIAVMARAGDAVKEGDVLLQIDTESLLIQLNQQTSTADATRAQLALAESQLLRATDLTERGLTASSNLEQAQSSANALRANLAALEAQVEGARIALQNATVKSPMDGIISDRAVQPGQTVQQGATLFTIVDLDQLYLNGSAPVGASAQIAKGQAVSIAVEGFPNRTFEGTVDRVNPIAVAGTRTIPVYIMLSNDEGLLRGGMFATGQIVVAEQVDGIAIPAVAIREDADGYFVLKLVDGTVERQAVEQGASWNGGRLIEIAAGLAPGDLVVTAALTQLQPGDKYEMVEG